MSQKRAFYILIGIHFFFPLFACDHHIDGEEENMVLLVDSTSTVPSDIDSTKSTGAQTDTTQNNKNSSDSAQRSTTVPDTTTYVSIPHDTITIAHWNIGHFALGKSANSSISDSDAERMANYYHNMLDSMSIDILGLCEFNPTFSTGGEKAKDMIVENYPYSYIGKKYSYNCNAIFSNGTLKESQEHVFPEKVQTRYYVKSLININGIDVTFVETHLDWNQGANGASYRKKQIENLVEEFKNSHYIIICADFNTSSLNEFQPFIDAGFSLSNGGEKGTLNTFPATSPKSPIDNIIVKGFGILDVKAIGDEKLSDHFLIKSRLAIIRNN